MPNTCGAHHHEVEHSYHSRRKLGIQSASAVLLSVSFAAVVCSEHPDLLQSPEQGLSLSDLPYWLISFMTRSPASKYESSGCSEFRRRSSVRPLRVNILYSQFVDSLPPGPVSSVYYPADYATCDIEFCSVFNIRPEPWRLDA